MDARAPLIPGALLPVPGDEAIMRGKAHGTTAEPVQQDLRWSCDRRTADKICSFNRHYAEVREGAEHRECSTAACT